MSTTYLCWHHHRPSDESGSLQTATLGTCTQVSNPCCQKLRYFSSAGCAKIWTTDISHLSTRYLMFLGLTVDYASSSSNPTSCYITMSGVSPITTHSMNKMEYGQPVSRLRNEFPGLTGSQYALASQGSRSRASSWDVCPTVQAMTGLCPRRTASSKSKLLMLLASM